MEIRKYFNIFSVMAITILLLVAIVNKSENEEKPLMPMPEIFVGGEKLAPYLGNYVWNGESADEMEPKEFLRDKKYYPINPIDDLLISFPGEKPEKLEVNFLYEHPDYDLHAYSGPVPEDELAIQIGNEPGITILVIQAEWDENKKAEYFVPLRLRKINSYQHLFPEDEGTFRLLYFYDSETIKVDPVYRTVLDGHLLPIFFTYKYEDKQYFQQIYADINVSGDQGYWLFGKEGLVFESTSPHEVIDFLAEHFEPVRFSSGGFIEEIDRDEKMIYVGSKKLFVEDVEQYKIGQYVSVEVTFHDLLDEKNQTFHKIEIIDEEPEILHDPKWFASRSGAYTLLGDDFNFQFAANVEDVEPYVETVHQVEYNENRDFDLLRDRFVIFDDEGPVFISDRWYAIVDYLEKIAK